MLKSKYKIGGQNMQRDNKPEGGEDMKILVKPVLGPEEIIPLSEILLNAIFKENREVVKNLFLNEDEKISQSINALFFIYFFDIIAVHIGENGLPSEPDKAFLYGKIFAFLSTDDPVNSFRQYLKNHTEYAINDIFDCFYCTFDILKSCENGNFKFKQENKAKDLFRFSLQ